MDKYRIQLTWDEEDKIYIAGVPELEGVSTHGNTRAAAMKYAEEAIDLHLKTLAEMNAPFPQAVSEKNLSGNMSLRMGKDVHEIAAIHADAAGKSLNEYIVDLILKEDNKDEIDAAKDLLEDIFTNPTKASAQLPRAEVIKKLWAYTKTHNLRPVKVVKGPKPAAVGMMGKKVKPVSQKRRYK